MAIGNLYHAGFLSSIKYDNLTPWFTTTSNNQVIAFQEIDGTQRYLNSLFIESESIDLYIRALPSDYCFFVPANSSINLDFKELKSIQIMNTSGVKLRWSGLYF